jgi:adenylate cyclase
MAVPAQAALGGIKGAIEREERAGLSYVFYGRVLVLALLAIYTVLSVPATRSVVYLGVMAVFLVLGLIPYLLQRRRRIGVMGVGAFLVADALLLTVLMVAPNPLFGADLPVQFTQRLPNFLFLLLFLCGVALSYSPKLVLLVGAGLAGAWSLGFLWLATRSDSIIFRASDIVDMGLRTSAERATQSLDPHAVNVTLWMIQTVILVLVTLVLALSVWRSRRLVGRVARTEAAKMALSRYFSPNLVSRLASSGTPIGEIQRQPAVILFVDIVGFSGQAEGLAPERVVALLRSFHRRMAEQVFAHDGTIDKYIGDCVMATFGTPQSGPRDASNALRCARAMCADLVQWNAKRAARGAAPMAVGIGLHYGPVVMGNIGDERRLEFGVVGDTVNVASRLERLSRRLETQVVASDAAVIQAGREGCPRDVLGAFDPAGRTEIRGRQESLAIWTLAPAGAARQDHVAVAE